MIILRLLGSSDDKEKEKIGVARPEGPPLRGFRRHDTLVQKGIEAKSAYRHRLNRRSKKGHRCIGHTLRVLCKGLALSEIDCKALSLCAVALE